MDMLVKLYDLPPSGPAYARLREQGIEVRRALTPEKHGGSPGCGRPSRTAGPARPTWPWAAKSKLTAEELNAKAAEAKLTAEEANAKSS
jgi:hypothetical protein